LVATERSCTLCSSLPVSRAQANGHGANDAPEVITAGACVAAVSPAVAEAAVAGSTQAGGSWEGTVLVAGCSPAPDHGPP